MKKLFFILSMMLISTTSFAQEGKTTWGVHFDYLLDTPKNPGLGAFVGYEFLDDFRGVAEFDYLFKNKGVSGWNINANVEYLFDIPNLFTIYPIVGLNVLGFSGGDDDSSSKLGLNLGVGIQYPIADNIYLKAEYLYKTQWNGLSTVNIGVALAL